MPVDVGELGAETYGILARSGQRSRARLVAHSAFGAVGGLSIR